MKTKLQGTQGKIDRYYPKFSKRQKIEVKKSQENETEIKRVKRIREKVIEKIQYI